MLSFTLIICIYLGLVINRKTTKLFIKNKLTVLNYTEFLKFTPMKFLYKETMPITTAVFTASAVLATFILLIIFCLCL